MSLENARITIIANSHQKILVNDITLRTDENGVLVFNVLEILGSQDRGLQQFDTWADEVIGCAMKYAFYDTIIDSGRFGYKEIAGYLRIDRTLAENIVTVAYQNNIVKKQDTQWCVTKENKLEIRKFMQRQKTMKLGNEQTLEEAIEEARRQDRNILDDVEQTLEEEEAAPMIPARKVKNKR